MTRQLSFTGALGALAVAFALSHATFAQAQPWTEDAKLISGDSAPEDLYGTAIAASGDTVVVTAPGRLVSGHGAGAAYVFVRAGAGWALQQKLVSSDVGVFFGVAVAIEGDTIAIGDSFNNTQRGSVHVFTRSGTVWTQQAKLTSGDTVQIGQSFGDQIALSGETLMVTATHDSEAGLSSVGAVYVFTRSGGVWTLQQTMHANPLIANQFFGLGLALDGDRAAIGQTDAFGRGVRIYQRSGGVFSSSFRIAAPSPVDGFFGFELDLEGDRLMVASRGDDQAATNAGAAYVFQLNVSNWIQTAKLLPSTTSPDGYGFRADMEGDTIVLGSTSANVAALEGGAAQVFVREDVATWTNLATLIASDAVPDAGFSQGLAIHGGSIYVGAWAPGPKTPPPPPVGCGGRGQPLCPPPPPPPSGSAYEFVIGEVDTQAPDFDIPADNMSFEATSSAGAVATFAFSATDDVDGPISAVCTPASGSVFGFGATLVSCTATDAAGNAASDSFTLHVADTTDPDAVCTDVVKECTGERTPVTTSCTATDAVDTDLYITSTAQPSYPVSVHQYQCTASDDHLNADVEFCSVHITDTVPPTCDAPETGYVACTQEGGVESGQVYVLQYIDRFAVGDSCDLRSSSISAPDFLPAGCTFGQASTITVTARDEVGNTTSCSGDVVVYDSFAPTVTVPEAITLECDTLGGVAGGDANITAWLSDATVVDVCHDEALAHDAPAFFAVGNTSVEFVGTDTCGNAADRSSTVTVVDTTAPSASCENAVVECTGALTPVTTTCGGGDICDGTPALISDAAPSYALGQHAFACHAQDAGGNGGSASCQVSVVDTQAPVIGAIVTNAELVAVGTVVSASATFNDVCGTHNGTWAFGDGSSSAATVAGGSVSGSHAYTTPGVYTLTLTLSDDSGNSSSAVHQYVVVFDPNGGSVSGSGSINSPAGAYTPNPSLMGKASFGFVARYQHGAHVPDGHTNFRFRAADFEFRSDAYDWLVVAGAHAKYRGTGSVNGVAGFRFMLTGTDGARPGGGGTDRLHLKVWAASGGVIYDNEPGAADDASATYAIDSGKIVIKP